MALRELTAGWEHTKTYATEAALRRKIEACKNDWAENDDHFMVVRTPEGRWTAIVLLDRHSGGYIGRYDFMKV